jgi:hypothetical protein
MASTWFSSKINGQQLLCLLESKLEADNRAIYHRL